MAKLIKCKICGDTEFTEIGELLQCRSCKHKSPKPKENAELLERANNLRFETKSFDEAASLYEEIIRLTPDEAEAYWGRVLCRYGIEYVKDTNGAYLPTCHRTLEGSILDDADYKMAVSKAAQGMSSYYTAEAQTIDEYQKKIKIIAAREDPYDVFISFKATDEYGRPTEDSLLAQELYYYLTKNLGLKVFFSNITLKDKAGQEYEPIIYAALSSATVMVLVGTKPEYINATWVKNEWSRYVKMIATAREQNKSKYIVTALKNMKPEQLPSVLAAYQAVNLAELGAKEKLCSNIDSLIGDLRVAAQKTAVSTVSVGASDMLSAEANNLCHLGFQQLAQRDFDKAGDYFQKAIEKKSDLALAHWGLMLVYYEVDSDEELGRERYDIKDNAHYKMAMQYASAEERMRFERIDSLIDASFEREADELCNRGYEKLAQGAFDEAYDLFEQAMETNGDISRAYWGQMLANEEVRSDEELATHVGNIEKDQFFQAAMQFATPEETARYNAVVAKMKESGLEEADFLLDRAESYLRGELTDHKQFKNDVLMAITLKSADIPGRLYWAWLRLFLGAADDEMMAQIAYPVKDDIFYQRAIKNANPGEISRYERIANQCEKLYYCRVASDYHRMMLWSNSRSVVETALNEHKTPRIVFSGELNDEIILSMTHDSYSLKNTEAKDQKPERILDKYMVKYLAQTIPDPYDTIEGESENSRLSGVLTDNVSLYMYAPGKYTTLVQRSVQGALGLSEEDTQKMIENYPCYIAHDVPLEKARELYRELRSHGTTVYIHAKPLDDIIASYKNPVHPNEAVSIYLTATGRHNDKPIINALREKFGLDKRAAKDAVANTPEQSFKAVATCVARNVPLSQATDLLAEFCEHYARAEIRLQ